jgi:hypothetical protein
MRGGLPVVVDGEVIGGIGASFAIPREDEQVAKAGPATLGNRSEPAKYKPTPAVRRKQGDRNMFSLTSSSIGHASPSRCGRPASQGMASAVVVGAATFMLVPALAFGQATPNSPRFSREQHACSVILGLGQSGQLYETCISSLNRSLAEWDKQELVETERNTCIRNGFEPGTRSFADCVLNSRKTVRSP